jgi:hypothetical protein
MGGTCSTYGERRGIYRAVLGKIEGKRPLGRPGLRWEDNSKIYLLEVVWCTWTGLIWLGIGTGAGLL